MYRMIGMSIINVFLNLKPNIELQASLEFLIFKKSSSVVILYICGVLLKDITKYSFLFLENYIYENNKSVYLVCYKLNYVQEIVSIFYL